MVVEAGAIVAVGPTADVAAAFPDARPVELGGAVVGPGFVDTHCHLEWSLTGGLASAEAGFAAWLGALLELSPRMRPEDFTNAADLGAVRALLGGTTTLADSGPLGAAAGALTRTGQRGIVHVEAFGRQRGDEARAVAGEIARRVLEVERTAGALVQVGVSPHAPYTVGPELWQALLDHPELSGRRWTTHLAESPDEASVVASGDGPLGALFSARGTEPGRWPGSGGPVTRLHAAGVLRDGLVAAHCVHLDEGEPDLLAAAGVGVAHCPLSNAALSAGTAPFGRLRAAGVAVGLGSDSPASAGDYHLRTDAEAARAAHGGDLLGDETLLAILTIDGARVLGLDGAIGTLEPGKRADLIGVVPTSPTQDPIRSLLDPTSHVAFVLVDGQVVVDAGRPVRVDPLEVLGRATSSRERLTG